ncbi:MAG: VRR-NUC domain-containing protein [Treponema sp.]|nr:VRR-NUC domain-containing protein [Treponema sp.]
MRGKQHMTPENAVIKECLEYLNLKGIFAWRNQTGALASSDGKRFIRFGKVGSADIIGILPGGRFIAVECKAPNGRLSDYQLAFLTDVEHMGGVAVIARSSEDIEKALKKARAEAIA